MRDRDRLQEQVDILKTTIIVHQLSMPAGVEEAPSLEQQSTSESSGMPTTTTVSYSTDDFDHERFHIDWSLPTANDPQAINPYIPSDVDVAVNPFSPSSATGRDKTTPTGTLS